MTKRNFSSGCIRIEKPIELAAYLLRNDPNWTRQKIRNAIDSLERQVVRLPKPIAIQILYFTAWVDEAGMVHFRGKTSRPIGSFTGTYGKDRKPSAS